MLKRALLIMMTVLGIFQGHLWAQGSVVTFSKSDLAAYLVAACGPQGNPRGKVHVHRNGSGNMLYIVAEGQAEGLIFAQTQNGNPLSSNTIDLWREDRTGAVVAQLAHRFEDVRLLVGSEGDGIAGTRFDIEPSGQYLVVSHGNVSSVSPVARPYFRTVDIEMDAQRIFLRHGGLLVVGNNHQTGLLQAVPVSLQGGTAVKGAPLSVGNMPAGVKVLDYNESTDDLLLGGLDATGRTSFAIVNLTSGQAHTVPSTRPDAEFGLFIKDPALAARLGGTPGAVSAPTGQQAPTRTRSRGGLFGWLHR